MSRRKFRPGRRITDPGRVINALIAGRWLYWNHKPQHPGWLLSMQASCLAFGARRGLIRAAIPQEPKP